MKDLNDFKNSRIEALTKNKEELERRIFELTDEDCPSDYKKVIRTELLK